MNDVEDGRFEGPHPHPEPRTAAVPIAELERAIVEELHRWRTNEVIDASSDRAPCECYAEAARLARLIQKDRLREALSDDS